MLGSVCERTGAWQKIVASVTPTAMLSQNVWVWVFMKLLLIASRLSIFLVLLLHLLCACLCVSLCVSLCVFVHLVVACTSHLVIVLILIFKLIQPPSLVMYL